MPEWVCGGNCPFWFPYSTDDDPRCEGHCDRHNVSAYRGDTCCDSLDDWEAEYQGLALVIAARRKVENPDA
jgi:hypothetical protein